MRLLYSAAAILFVQGTVVRAQGQPKLPPFALAAPSAPPRAVDSVTIRIVGTELRSAVQIMQQYLDRPVIFSGAGSGPQVTLETPRPVPRADIPRLMRGLLESAGYEFVSDSASGTYRARPAAPATPARLPMSSSSSPAGAAGSGAQRQGTGPELFVIALKHARAADVAATVNTLFGRGPSNGNGGTQQQTAGRTLTDELRGLQVPSTEPPLPQSIAGTSGRTAALTGDMTIVPDAHANSLLLRVNRADFELIQAAVAQIDVRPPQVLIEVLIVEAAVNSNFSLGVQSTVDQQHIKNTENTTVGGAFTPGDAGLGDFTLKVMGASGIDIGATISAAAGRGAVKIISRPVVLTENDEQAEVVVGSQRPFVQVSRSLPTSDAVRDQVVQYKDVGTKLNVRPTISVDGTVQLHVMQEVSNATTETAFDAPVISTRSVRTDLLVHDGQTIVLGGLTDTQHDTQSEGIPLLSSIPFIGGFFGRQSRTTSQTELFIFLTPRVIRTDEDADRLTKPLRERADKVKP
ncbi:MAG: secretin N-terminal domain-containing protein [Gemmatimonadaceae bacterium]